MTEPVLNTFSDLTIISPTLNEEKNIEELLSILSESFVDVSIIIVDDGSSDRTTAIVEDWSTKNKKVRLINRKNAEVKGLTASVMEGIKDARTNFFAVIDADLQHPPLLIKDLYDLANLGTSFVAGVRKPYQENQGWHRILVTKVATQLAKFYLKFFKGLSCSDPMSGFFVAQTKLCQEIINNFENRFEPKGYKIFFDLLKLAPKGITYQEIQYQFSFRTSGKSKLNPMHAIYFLRGLFK